MFYFVEDGDQSGWGAFGQDDDVDEMVRAILYTMLYGYGNRWSGAGWGGARMDVGVEEAAAAGLCASCPLRSMCFGEEAGTATSAAEEGRRFGDFVILAT